MICKLLVLNIMEVMNVLLLLLLFCYYCFDECVHDIEIDFYLIVLNKLLTM